LTIIRVEASSAKVGDSLTWPCASVFAQRDGGAVDFLVLDGGAQDLHADRGGSGGASHQQGQGGGRQNGVRQTQFHVVLSRRFVGLK
jgi:hypothetical protein